MPGLLPDVPYAAGTLLGATVPSAAAPAHVPRGQCWHVKHHKVTTAVQAFDMASLHLQSMAWPV